MENKKTPVHLFLRKKTQGFNSIEVVFDQIISYDKKKEASIKTFVVPFKTISPVAVWNNLSFCFKSKGSINHISGDIQYVALALGKNTLLTIHDVQSILGHPNRVKRWFLSLFWFKIPARICKRISFISEFSRDEFLRYFPSFKEKTVVVPNPAPIIPDEVVRFKNQLIRNGQFDLEILQVGTKWNKNLERIIEAIDGKNYQIHIVGKLSDTQLKLLQHHAISYQNYENLSYPDLLKLYASCDVVTFISLYEGFGMPILEAQSIGVPVIASNRCAMPEITGKGGFIVDPMNIHEMRTALNKLEDENLRAELIKKGKINVRRFSVEKIYGQYASIYAEIA
ncbi:MAG: glycosyltransferase family 1 protein [Cyclobacteriaceae bacterium]